MHVLSDLCTRGLTLGSRRDHTRSYSWNPDKTSIRYSAAESTLLRIVFMLHHEHIECSCCSIVECIW